MDVVPRPQDWRIIGINITVLGENETGEVWVSFPPRKRVVPKDQYLIPECRDSLQPGLPELIIVRDEASDGVPHYHHQLCLLGSLAEPGRHPLAVEISRGFLHRQLARAHTRHLLSVPLHTSIISVTNVLEIIFHKLNILTFYRRNESQFWLFLSENGC